MTFQTQAPINYVYCIVARSRVNDVATTAIVERVTQNSGDTLVADKPSDTKMANSATVGLRMKVRNFNVENHFSPSNEIFSFSVSLKNVTA